MTQKSMTKKYESTETTNDNSKRIVGFGDHVPQFILVSGKNTKKGNRINAKN